MFRRQFLNLAPRLSTFALGTLNAQEPPSDTVPTFQVDVNVFTLTTTETPLLVRAADAQGRGVSGEISPEAVTVESEKQKYRVTRVRPSQQPLRLGLLFDVSRSQFKLLDQQLEAAAAFVESFVRCNDSTFVATFGPVTEAVTPATSDKVALANALRDIPSSLPARAAREQDSQRIVLPAIVGNCDPHRLGNPSQRVQYRQISPHFYGPICKKYPGTMLWAALEEFAGRWRRDDSGRITAFVVITDGINCGNGSAGHADRVLKNCGVVLYGIRYYDKAHYIASQYPANPADFDRLAYSTGGRVFTPSSGNLSAIFSTLHAELRTCYEVFINVPDSAPKPNPDSLKVSINDPSVSMVKILGVGAAASKSWPTCPDSSSMK